MYLVDNDYPRWSHTFGVTVRSRQHLKELEKRYGVVLCTSDDMERGVDKMSAAHDEADVRMDATDEEYRSSSAFNDFRRGIERGVHTDHLPADRRERAKKQLFEKYCK